MKTQGSDPKAVQTDEIAKSLKAIRRQLSCASDHVPNVRQTALGGYFANIEAQVRKIELVAGLRDADGKLVRS